VGELDIGKLASHASYHLAPKTRALQNIRFVNREQAPAPGASEFKCDAGDTLDFRLAVAHCVDRMARAGSALNRSRLAEIKSAKQFAHDQNIGSLDDLLAQRRAGRQRRMKDRGTQIRERSQLLAQAQQSSFGANFTRIVIVGWAADRAEQHRL